MFPLRSFLFSGLFLKGLLKVLATGLNFENGCCKPISGDCKYVYYHYYESGGEHNVAKHVGIRSDRYKLIFFYENNEWELYDLQKDPTEVNNIYNAPAYQQIQDSMKAELQTQMKKYKDTI